jgi:hypothetical protein
MSKKYKTNKVYNTNNRVSNSKRMDQPAGKEEEKIETTEDKN